MKEFKMGKTETAFAALLLAMAGTPASAHIVLSQPSFEAGQNYAAFFKVEHGCEGSPTVALRVQIPDGVKVLQAPEKPGWKLETRSVKDSLTEITWRGHLDAKAA